MFFSTVICSSLAILSPSLTPAMQTYSTGNMCVCSRQISACYSQSLTHLWPFTVRLLNIWGNWIMILTTNICDTLQQRLTGFQHLFFINCQISNLFIFCYKKQVNFCIFIFCHCRSLEMVFRLGLYLDMGLECFSMVFGCLVSASTPILPLHCIWTTGIND